MVQDAPSAPRVVASASPAAAIPAVIYCEGQFGIADGKTAHGLMRHSERYRIVAVIDSLLAGRDAGLLLDGVANGVPVVADLAAAYALGGAPPQVLIYGMAPANGLFSPADRLVLLGALRAGLSLVSGMREFLGDDAEFAATAKRHQVSIEDVRRPPALKDLRLFSGMIQGGRYGLPLDAIPSQFCSGEVEAAVVQAFDTERPQVIVIEGQGALTHPAYLSSTFILRGSQPQAVILQHAPMRRQRCDFPQEAMPTPQSEIALIEAFAPTRVIGMTLNHEGMDVAELPAAIALYEAELHIPVSDALACPPERLVQMVMRAFPELGAAAATVA